MTEQTSLQGALSQLDDETKHDLVGQTAKIRWCELERFFAAGKVIEVKAPLNLISVGTALINDDMTLFQAWVEARQIAAVSDSQAKIFVDHDATVWALAVSPWVLIQQVNDGV